MLMMAPVDFPNCFIKFSPIKQQIHRIKTNDGNGLLNKERLFFHNSPKEGIGPVFALSYVIFARYRLTSISLRVTLEHWMPVLTKTVNASKTLAHHLSFMKECPGGADSSVFSKILWRVHHGVN